MKTVSRVLEEDQQPEEDPGEQDAPRGRTITIDVPDSPSDDPQPDDGSPQPEQGDAGKGGGESWNPPSSGDGGGSGDDKPGETYSDGTYDTIPSAGKVAASGPYANIVQSLGGKGALAAAPQQWLDALPDAAYGNGSELADVKGIASWGDGTQMTDAAVREVIDSGAECVLTSNTYNSMTQDQADAFNKAGVNVLLMPDIGVHNAMDSDIVTAVDVVGELLKDAGSSIEFNAKSAAATWKSMHNRALASCLASNGGYTCIMWGNYYVENYLYQGSSEQASKNRISNYTSHRVYVDYIDLWSSGATRGTGNLMNNGDARSSFDLIDYYFQHSGAYRGTVAISQYSNFALENHPGIDKVRVSERSSQSIEIGDQVVTNEDYGLPTPVTFTRDKQIALKVAESASGSRDSIYNTGYDYTVWVMPSGPSGSWNDGTFESYLLAPWTYSVIRNHGTSDADGMVRDFYSTFYRCDNASDLIQGYGKEVNVTCAR